MPTVTIAPVSSGMARARRVGAIWNWLPAFRVVAEYESIHKAALVLRVSASALSRTVRLLEDALGEPLFVRVAGRLGLTSFGGEVLEATRDAMRRIDEVVEESRGALPAARELVAAACGVALGSLLARAIGRAAAPSALASSEGGPRARIAVHDSNEVIAELLRGNLDVALVDEAADATGVDCERLGELVFAMYAPAGACEGAAIVALCGLRSPQAEAQVRVLAPTVDDAAQIAEAGLLRALLPDGLAPPSFQRLRATDARVAVHALTRRPIGGAPLRGETRALIEETRALLASFAQRVARPTA